MSDIFEHVYKRGVAAGHSDIRSDSITLRFENETFTFPTGMALRVARWNGYFYEAPIDEVRKLEAEAASG